jgi:hypothetical protein
MNQNALDQPDAPTNTLPELIDKARAAKILGHRGTRQVLKLVTVGKLEAVKQRNEKTGRVAVLFRLEDVRRFKAERDKPKAIDVAPAGGVAVQSPGNRPANAAKLPPGLRELAVLLEAVGVREETKPSRPWLTFDEAIAYTGWPARGLEQFVSSGRIPYLDFGKGTRGGRYRFKRGDLDSLGESVAHFLAVLHQIWNIDTKEHVAAECLLGEVADDLLMPE